MASEWTSSSSSRSLNLDSRLDTDTAGNTAACNNQQQVTMRPSNSQPTVGSRARRQRQRRGGPSRVRTTDPLLLTRGGGLAGQAARLKALQPVLRSAHHESSPDADRIHRPWRLAPGASAGGSSGAAGRADANTGKGVGVGVRAGAGAGAGATSAALPYGGQAARRRGASPGTLGQSMLPSCVKSATHLGLRPRVHAPQPAGSTSMNRRRQRSRQRGAPRGARGTRAPNSHRPQPVRTAWGSGDGSRAAGSVVHTSPIKLSAATAGKAGAAGTSAAGGGGGGNGLPEGVASDGHGGGDSARSSSATTARESARRELAQAEADQNCRNGGHLPNPDNNNSSSSNNNNNNNNTNNNSNTTSRASSPASAGGAGGGGGGLEARPVQPATLPQLGHAAGNTEQQQQQQQQQQLQQQQQQQHQQHHHSARPNTSGGDGRMARGGGKGGSKRGREKGGLGRGGSGSKSVGGWPRTTTGGAGGAGGNNSRSNNSSPRRATPSSSPIPPSISPDMFDDTSGPTTAAMLSKLPMNVLDAYFGREYLIDAASALEAAGHRVRRVEGRAFGPGGGAGAGAGAGGRKVKRAKKGQKGSSRRRAGGARTVPQKAETSKWDTALEERDQDPSVLLSMLQEYYDQAGCVVGLLVVV